MRRMQLSRSRGWRLPKTARSVAYPTVYANPFRATVRTETANQEAVTKYRAWLYGQPALVDRARYELRGYDLACWCPAHLPCHADVLLEVVSCPSTLLLWDTDQILIDTGGAA